MKIRSGGSVWSLLFAATSLASAADVAVQQPLQPTLEGYPSDGPGPYTCEYYGNNDCWRPKYVMEGPPYSHNGKWPKRGKTCVVEAASDPDVDDAPAIRSAFSECKSDGHIIFENTTYHIHTVLNTTWLKDVDIEIRGTLLWNTDIEYWLKNSLPFGFQNQTSAWHVGGENIHMYGHGYGTLDGNGEVWYDYNHGQSNLHGRPHAITITDTVNSVVEGLRFINSQMWTMTVIRSERMLLQDIWINNTAIDLPWRGNVNTDGVDTVYANNITFLRWTIDNGDDSISPKQNSTNIYIANCTFINGEGVAVGSIGQYPGQIEVVENITAEGIVCYNTQFAARIKTWTGLITGYPPNGGGAGLGYARNCTFRNFELHGITKVPLMLTQCTSYNGVPGGCDTSQFSIHDISFTNSTGEVIGDNVAELQCSKAAPCDGIKLGSNNLWRPDSEKKVEGVLCSEVKEHEGFECTGTAPHGKPTRHEPPGQ